MSKFCTFSPDKIPKSIKLFPFRIEWVDLRVACATHDADWLETKERRIRADVDFYYNLLEAGCPKWIAKLYYRAVRIFGFIGL